MLLGGVGAGRSGGAGSGRLHRDMTRLPIDGHDLGPDERASVPASVVAEVKTGDIVFVTVNVINTKTAAIAGPIASVDRDKGTVTVATASGPFTFSVVPEKLREMRPGDPLVLKLEVVDIGPPGGEPPHGSQQPR